MSDTSRDHAFAGSIPQLYERHLVPLIFQPYADDLAARVVALQPASVLEVAAGTGVVTRQLAQRLPAATRIVATDLNQAMLDQAALTGTARPVVWRQADALQLPFPDESFDALVCQFGVMFFPDKAAAFAEARRVLRPGGHLLFNVWGRIDHNDFAQVATQALTVMFPEDPPRFLARTPHGYYERAVIEQDLRAGGFTAAPEFVTVTARSRAESARIPALAYCEGTPLRNEIEARPVSRLSEATSVVEAALAERFGAGPIEGKIQAHVITVRR